MLRFDLRTVRTQAPVVAAGSVQPGHVLCLIGSTGAGKSTLLHMLSGREPAEGILTLTGAGTEPQDPARVTSGTCQDLMGLPPHRRRLAHVPQRPVALWPARTVRETLRRVQRLTAHARLESNPTRFAWEEDPGGRRTRLLAAFRLEPLADRLAAHLSGGELQRLVLAQALASGPRGLLLDEPLSQQDPAARPALADGLAAAIRDHSLPAIWATHDVAEAQRVATEIAILDAGQICFRGTPDALLTHPPTAALARLVGYTAFLPLMSGEVVGVHPDRAVLGPVGPRSDGPWLPVAALAGQARPWGGRRLLTLTLPSGPETTFAIALGPDAVLPREGECVTVHLLDPPHYPQQAASEVIL